jgi:hypothetical protein
MDNYNEDRHEEPKRLESLGRGFDITEEQQWDEYLYWCFKNENIAHE